jgi:hypothetical protein
MEYIPRRLSCNKLQRKFEFRSGPPFSCATVVRFVHSPTADHVQTLNQHIHTYSTRFCLLLQFVTRDKILQDISRCCDFYLITDSIVLVLQFIFVIQKKPRQFILRQNDMFQLLCRDTIIIACCFQDDRL